MQTGPGRAATIQFGYDLPPIPGRPGLLPYLRRRIVDRFYFSLIRHN